MIPDSESNLRLEIGHVLFIDIVGYSKLLIEEQKERFRQLTEIVLASPQVAKSTSEQLVRLPTGDGMALVFRNSSEEPARCALEIAEALRKHPEIAVRMGIHSGPVSEVTDVSGRTNIAGAGINIAQRVMDCGDGGHILLSRRVAEDLESYRQWAPHLHSLGECEVKHGVRVHLVNFYTDEIGNAQFPEKFRQLAEKEAARVVPRRDEELRVAVLPFKSMGDAETESFAEGLVEDVTTGLSRFGYLSVVANALDARYVLKGSIRKGGSGIRVIAQLVDSRTGTQLWAETYNRDLQGLTIFDAQEDIAARVVATVADSYGVLVHSLREASGQKDDADFTPAEWQFQYFAYREQITPAAHGALRSRLERASKAGNPPSDLWACLAQVYVDEYAFGFPGDDGKSLDRALAAARRGVELDRANQFAMVALAQTHFFRQDLAAFGPAAERAMALNPLNTDALGILGLEIVHTGEFERGTAIVRRAMGLNPNHAGWMHFAPLWDHFHKGEYENALECANRVDVPGLFWPFLVMASACGHLGRRTEAAAAVRDLLALDPEFGAHARSNVGTWHFASGLMEPILEGLRKAGLSIPEEESSDSPSRSGQVTAKADRAKPGPKAEAVRTDEGFWVAVLPFKYSGSNADLAALAEGLTEEIATGLSRFSYLEVIARGATSRYAQESVDVRSVGKELGARYVMEGSVRQAGPRLRVAVQLVDTVSGTHLWAETYDRAFVPEDLFTLQDDLVPRIVSTVADQNGVLTRRMSETLRSKSEDALTPHEAALRAFTYFERVTPEEHAVVRRILERAVREAPDYADCWAMLSIMYSVEFADDFNPEPNPLDRALAAAERAVQLAATHALGHYALAFVYFLRKEIASFRAEAEKALALNPMDGSIMGILGVLENCAGELERGCQMVEAAMQLNPNHSALFRWADFTKAYAEGKYAKAFECAVRINMPNYFYAYSARAAALGQLGRREAAEKELRELLALRPDFATAARREYSKWHDSDTVEHMIEGLCKAGLEIADDQSGSR
jgi:TolB-like protein